ncbi:MAG: phosphoribosylformylglycinamidine synthase subunit PurS [Phycisphaeraceae bacterium]
MTSSASVTAPHEPSETRVFRVEAWTKPGEIDPAGAAAFAEARRSFPGLEEVHVAHVYLVEAPVGQQGMLRIANELFADPVNQQAELGARPVDPAHAMVEVHYQPGVMDPVAQSARDAITEMLPEIPAELVGVRTGYRYDLAFQPGHDLPGADALRQFAQRALANPVIQDIHLEPFTPAEFPHGRAYELKLTHVPIRELDDEGLARLSRDGHLFLSQDEMRAIQDYYRQAQREPTDAELETLAQTWSEHCVHKTLKSTVHFRQTTGDQLDYANRPGHEVHPDGSVTIHNLLKNTVAAATRELMAEPPHKDWCVSVFVDNAGIVRFDDVDGVAIKVETHNHPSAIEPYGGAATGIGGCIRDVLGTGLAARPIANTDVFCVACPEASHESEPEGENATLESDEFGLGDMKLPKGVIHPRRILQQIVAGVRDYGNRMGIPTVSGAVYFDEDFVGNPLVYAGCVGLIPLDKCFGDAKPGDRIIVLGGATGRDGIHGATFSSAELTDTHADEFAHAVQIGNPITEKKVADVIFQARDWQGGPLYTAITDCGAGGFSSAVGEMGEKVGAKVTLETAPLKYQGLSYTEIWISEAQERMVLSVPEEKVETLRRLCESEDVGFCDLGVFGCGPDGPTTEQPDDPTLILTYQGTEVGRLGMEFLHEGVPMPTRTAEWHSHPAPEPAIPTKGEPSVDELLINLLAHPNIASKHWIVRQYDHEVQGSSAVKPLVGPEQDGPSDAAVLRPKLDSSRGVALACGLAPHLSEKATARGLATDGDSYHATLAALDEAVRNAVCVGADPDRIAILDNFCWPRCEDPAQLGTLVRAAEACYDGAKAYRTPFVSGKDSLSNQFTTEDGRLITIPPTMLITAMGIVEDTARCRTMDAKQPGSALLVVGETTAALGGSHYVRLTGDAGRSRKIPRLDLTRGPAAARAVAKLITGGQILSAHDCSEGGLLVAAAEMAFAGRVGLDLDLAGLPADRELDPITACFAETPGRYLLEVAPDQLDAVLKTLQDADLPVGQVGSFADHDELTLRTPAKGRILSAKLDDLRQAWLEPLDW